MMQNVRLAKVALRPGAGNMVNAILRKLVLLKVLPFPANVIHILVVSLKVIHLFVYFSPLTFNFGLQEQNSLPVPKLEGDDRAQARALATLYSHPVVRS